MHITLKVGDKTLKEGERLPGLREGQTWVAITRVIAAFHRAQEMRICHFSVQGDHLHLICEGADATVVSRGMCSLGRRLAHALNGLWGRTGGVFKDRYHREDLTSPRQVRNAIRYVFANVYKHERDVVRFVGKGGKTRPDPYSFT